MTTTGTSATATARTRAIWRATALPVISILLALLVGAVLILASELLLSRRAFDPLLPLIAYRWLFTGAVGTPGAIVESLVFTTPLLLAGLAVGLGFRAGLFNIGALGQFLMGALTACWIGIWLKDAPGLVAIPAALGAGMLGGALFGAIPGYLKALSGAHEVVTTIMLNYVAIAILAAIVSGPLKAPGAPNPITEDIGNAAFPTLGDLGTGLPGWANDAHLGLLVAVAAAVVVAWLLFRTTLGFEIRTVGANPDAARYAGMHPRVLMVLTMSLSGLLAGTAGAGQVLGINHMLTGSFSTTVGFDSIAVALLGRSNPLGIVAASLLFGAMRAGAGLMQIQAGVPRELVDVVQATVLLFLVASPVLRRVFRLRGAEPPVSAGETAITQSYGGGGEAPAH